MDESAFYLLPLPAHSWAPRGQTPVLVEQAGRDHLSLIAAIAPNGRIYLAGQDQAFTGEDIVWFLTKLCSRYRKRDLLVIGDGASIHRSEAVKAFLRERPGRVHLERLPGYSPKLNPTELVWNQLKQRLKNQSLTDLTELMITILDQIKGLGRDPKLIQTFFNEEIAFATD